jgi:hypothetical protein
MNKATLRDIRRLANKLPATYTEVDVYRRVIGEALLNGGVSVTKYDVPIEGKKEYEFKTKIKQPVNNYRRLKKIYERDGIEKVREYVKEVIDLHLRSTKSLNGIKLENE